MRTEAAKRPAANAGFFSHYDETAATSLKVCVAESEAHVRNQVLKSLEGAGHTILIAREAADLLRYQCSEEGPDAFVGGAQLLAATQDVEMEAIKTPALLLARPEDTSFLPAFMKFNSGNDFALLPQSDESLRRSVSTFMLRQDRRKLLGFCAFGCYLFKKDTRQVFFDGEAVTLSPYRFELAQALLQRSNIAVPSEELSAVCGIEHRPNAQRMVNANIAVLAHQLKLDGRHGYRLEQRTPNVYCLSSQSEAQGDLAKGETGIAPLLDVPSAFPDAAGLLSRQTH